MTDSTGRIIVVYGAGGVGTTTIAISLATALQQQHQDIVLVDADMAFGDVGIHLQQETLFSTTDYARHLADNTDPSTAIATHWNGLSILSKPKNPVNLIEFQAVLLDLSERHEVVVIDVGRDLNEYTLKTIELADTVVMVCIPTPASLHNTKVALDTLSELETLIVVNSMRETDILQSVVSPHVIEDTLSHVITAFVPHVFPDAWRAMHQGVALYSLNKAVKQSLDELVKKLTPVQETIAPVIEERDSIHILIVDDLDETIDQLQKLLMLEDDFTVVATARDGETAVNLAKEFRPDIILMDIEMPGLDGFAATESLLQMGLTGAVIVMTIHKTFDNVRRSMIVGASGFIEKPMDAQELYTTIRNVHQQNRAVLAARQKLAPKPAYDRIRVYIIDDIQEAVDAFERLIGFEPDMEVVGSSRTSNEGIEQVLALRPDVVLMDIRLPDHDGLTTATRLSHMAPDIGIIFVSVVGDRDHARRAVQAGGKDFLTKPVNVNDLYDSIRRVAKSGAF